MTRPSTQTPGGSPHACSAIPPRLLRRSDAATTHLPNRNGLLLPNIQRRQVHRAWPWRQSTGWLYGSSSASPGASIYCTMVCIGSFMVDQHPACLFLGTFFISGPTRHWPSAFHVGGIFVFPFMLLEWWLLDWQMNYLPSFYNRSFAYLCHNRPTWLVIVKLIILSSSLIYWNISWWALWFFMVTIQDDKLLTDGLGAWDMLAQAQR